jgi:hypothetical protein
MKRNRERRGDTKFILIERASETDTQKRGKVENENEEREMLLNAEIPMMVMLPW